MSMIYSIVQLKETHCKGCCNLQCQIIPITKENKCPCIECIIKMICMDGCKEFKTFNHEYYERKKSNKMVVARLQI